LLNVGQHTILRLRFGLNVRLELNSKIEPPILEANLSIQSLGITKTSMRRRITTIHFLGICLELVKEETATVELILPQ
jgi:hypothetical protein